MTQTPKYSITLAEIQDYFINDDTCIYGDVYYDTKYKVCRQVSRIFSNDGNAVSWGLENEHGHDEDGEHNMDFQEQHEGKERYMLLFRNAQGLYPSTIQKILEDIHFDKLIEKHKSQKENLSIGALWAVIVKKDVRKVTLKSHKPKG